jgi:radical SAM protein with 4Fe4S-binding SPASM domain
MATANSGDGRGVLSLRGRLRAHAAARAVPLKLHLELTKRCNLRCYHCYLSEPGPELSTERVLRLLDEVAELGCMGVILTGGEIATRSDYVAVARGIKDRRMTLSLLTNGTLLSDDDLDTLAGIGPANVAVSMYSADPRTHDRVTGVPGSFARTLRTIEGLKGRGVRCSIHSPLMRDTLHGYAGVWRLAENLGIRCMFDPTIVPGDDGDYEVTRHCVDAHELRRFFLDRQLIDKTREGKIVTRDASADAAADERRLLGPCSAGITAVLVEANGDVLPCMGFRPAFGNIAERPFAEVWHGAEARRHRELMRQPPEKCGECELLRYCTTRCPRLAVSEGSSMRGPNRRACELAAIVRDMRVDYTRSA